MGKKFDPNLYIDIEEKNENKVYDDEYYYDDFEEGKVKKRKKGIIFSLVLLLCVVLTIVGFLVKKRYDQNQMIEQAENFTEMGKFEQAVDLYSQLYANTGDPQYNTLKKDVQLKKDVLSNLKKARDLKSQAEYVEAIKLYKEIPEEATVEYKEAQTAIEESRASIEARLDSLMEAKEYREARSLANDYLEAVPESDKAVATIQKCNREIKALNEDNSSPTESPIVIENNDDKSNAKIAANSLVGTYRTIVSGKANIRKGPSNKETVVGVLSRGDSVYIDEVYVESPQRTWCHTALGWVSYNTMNGSLK